MTVRSRFWFITLAALVAASGVAAAYTGRIDIGFYYDDYHMVRPWPPTDLYRVWYGSWDPTGIESAFFRPLTAWFFAARFQVFGLNGTAMHVMSIAGHALCAVMVACFLRREGGAAGVALVGAWIYTVHPLFPYAQVSWLTNQMHLLQSLIVLTALLAWQTARDRGIAWWLPVVLLAVASFLVKEDGIMLLPALAALTLLRVWILRASAPREWAWLLLIAVALPAALAGFRYDRLGRLGGYGWPTFDQGQFNLRRGLETGLFLWPTTRIWQAAAATMGVTSATAGAIVAWRSGSRRVAVAAVALAAALAFAIPPAFHARVPLSVIAWQGVASGVAISALALGVGVAMSRRDRLAGWLIVAGVALAASFNLPFVLVAKREQYQLLALGGVIAIAGAAQAFWNLSADPTRRALSRTAIVLLTIPLLVGARHMSAEFLPCTAQVLDKDQEARGWWVVPDQIRGWIDAKVRRCADGHVPTPVSDLPVVAWGVHEEQRDESIAYRWTSDVAVLLAGSDTASMTVAVRRPGASPAAPVRVTISGPGAPRAVTLDSGEWSYATLALTPSLRTRLRDGHRVDVTVDRWFVPAVEDPRSADLRRFGVQLQVSVK